MKIASLFLVVTFNLLCISVAVSTFIWQHDYRARKQQRRLIVFKTSYHLLTVLPLKGHPVKCFAKRHYKRICLFHFHTISFSMLNIKHIQ